MIPQIKPLFGMEEAQVVYDLVMSGSWLTEFKYTREFEVAISSFLEVKHCSAVPNGTLGLILALKACRIGIGDHVACPALTMAATATAISMVGAHPIFVDVDSQGCLDIYKLKEKVDAVMFVSLNGRMGNIKDVRDYCDYKKIPMIEDACQSLGSYKLGTIGDVGVFSLSPHKIISTGQGGLIVTNSDEIWNHIRHLRDFGRTKGGIDEHRWFGINAKFTDLQAVIGLQQLKYLEDRLKIKRLTYGRYRVCLGDIMYQHLLTPWMVDIYVDSPDELLKFLKENGIETRRMYPVVPHNDLYREYKKFPVAQELSDRGLWLPSSIDLTGNEVDKICQKILQFLGKSESVRKA